MPRCAPVEEIELKFQVPDAARAALRKAVATARARRTRLEAAYFDTADRRLARAGVALRLRKEGRRWVQALKAGGAHAMQRLEHEVPVAASSGRMPELDLDRHAGTPAAGQLGRALAHADGEQPLHERYRTDVMRTCRALRPRGAKVEVAFYEGRIVAGAETMPIAELEFELLAGTSRALIDSARRWVQRHAVWLDVRSKAERGDLLSQGLARAPARKAGASSLQRGCSVHAALRAGVRDCLAQMLPNASQIAGGAYDDEHVHQLRVGLRRLRSLLRFFEGAWPPEAAAWEPRLKALFQQLGATRDRDVLIATLVPALLAAGAPPVELPAPPPGADLAQALRAPDVTLLWLDLLAFASEAPEADRDRPQALEAIASERLDGWHQGIVKKRKRFDALDEEARHTLRKHAKRLRYAAEFVAPLYAAQKAERYLAKLPRLQESLGAYNDLCVASEAYRAALSGDARAWFALGWIAARRAAAVEACGRALGKFAKAKPFWDRSRIGS